MRIAGHARRITNRHLGDARSIKAGQSRNKAVQLSVEIDVFQHFRTISFERGSKIAELHTRGFRHQPIGDARRDLASEGVVHPIFPPAAGDVVTFFNFREQGRNVFRVVLQIPIQRDDDAALGLIKARRQRRGLAKIPAQPDHLHAHVGLNQIGQQIEAAIGGGVVHKNHFIWFLQRLQHAREAVVERKDGGLLIMNWNNDGDHSRSYSLQAVGRQQAALPPNLQDARIGAHSFKMRAKESCSSWSSSAKATKVGSALLVYYIFIAEVRQRI